jgi:hypothetical protein
MRIYTGDIFFRETAEKLQTMTTDFFRDRDQVPDVLRLHLDPITKVFLRALYQQSVSGLHPYQASMQEKDKNRYLF